MPTISTMFVQLYSSVEDLGSQGGYNPLPTASSIDIKCTEHINSLQRINSCIKSVILHFTKYENNLYSQKRCTHHTLVQLCTCILLAPLKIH